MCLCNNLGMISMFLAGDHFHPYAGKSFNFFLQFLETAGLYYLLQLL